MLGSLRNRPARALAVAPPYIVENMRVPCEVACPFHTPRLPPATWQLNATCMPGTCLEAQLLYPALHVHACVDLHNL